MVNVISYINAGALTSIHGSLFSSYKMFELKNSKKSISFYWHTLSVYIYLYYLSSTFDT